jgi:hypothetical protein
LLVLYTQVAAGSSPAPPILEGIWDWGGVFVSALAGFGVATLTWRWRWMLLLGVVAFVLTFVPVSALAILNALGDCTN